MNHCRIASTMVIKMENGYHICNPSASRLYVVVVVTIAFIVQIMISSKPTNLGTLLPFQVIAMQ